MSNQTKVFFSSQRIWLIQRIYKDFQESVELFLSLLKSLLNRWLLKNVLASLIVCNRLVVRTYYVHLGNASYAVLVVCIVSTIYNGYDA